MDILEGSKPSVFSRYRLLKPWTPTICLFWGNLVLKAAGGVAQYLMENQGKEYDVTKSRRIDTLYD